MLSVCLGVSKSSDGIVFPMFIDKLEVSLCLLNALITSFMAEMLLIM